MSNLTIFNQDTANNLLNSKEASPINFDGLRLRWLPTTNPLETYTSADILAGNRLFSSLRQW